MLIIEDLQVKIGNKKVLKHVNLEIQPGETQILFDYTHPVGFGKPATLQACLAGPAG